MSLHYMVSIVNILDLIDHAATGRMVFPVYILQSDGVIIATWTTKTKTRLVNNTNALCIVILFMRDILQNISNVT